MHIILAVLSGVAGVFWVIYRLNREGFDFASLNPFLWMRRAHWKRQYERDPLHSLSTPLEVASLLLLAMAKENGEISSEEKSKIKELIVSELKRTRKEADELFSMCSYLLRERETVRGEVADIVGACKSTMTTEQVRSISTLLSVIAHLDGEPSERQRQLMEEFQRQFQEKSCDAQWG